MVSPYTKPIHCHHCPVEESGKSTQPSNPPG
nr:MAG TPA: hypothetical protein [Caudoviricetes sp.]DAU41508.1 MAG TPA: hypothetical protein [Bacteriophage sp.]